MFKSFFKKKQKTIIIGMHGLGNKPPKGLLNIWWKHSLIEGLSKIPGAPKRFSFRMAYWADLVYEHPLNPRIKDPDHELHIEEPYIPEPIPTPKIGYTFWHFGKLAFDRIKETIFLSKHGLANYRFLFDIVIKSSFRDLAIYHEEIESPEEWVEVEPVRKKIRQRLKILLRKYQNHRILIVAHSMGSLIAYDVLSELAEQYKIEIFVSMGSPLGLPVLREKIAHDHKWLFDEDTLLPTPETVGEWYNYSDKEDHFAVFNDLATYYSVNKDGIGPKDYLVNNDYKDWVTNNAHKSFGYLRTPELAQVIANFLGAKHKNIWQKGKHFFRKIE